LRRRYGEVAEHRTAEELRDQHIRDMGPELGPVYNILFNDVYWLHAKWAQYRQLFARSERRIDLLNETAGYFSHIIQSTLFEDVVLGLVRLTDRIQTGNQQKNLTLQSLPSVVSDCKLRDELTGLADAALNACKSMKTWRDKRLAHRDLTVALATAEAPLVGISRADVEVALAAFRSLLNKLENYYLGSEVYYQKVLTNLGDADSLVYYLSKGLQAERALSERLQAGTLLLEDLSHWRRYRRRRTKARRGEEAEGSEGNM
jgi:hypothetical protein